MLEEFKEDLEMNLRHDDGELISRVASFFESKRTAKKRHYCFRCGARRNESEMKEYKKAAFGKMSWICNECGDSRFKHEVIRSEKDKSGKGQLTYVIK